MTARTDRLTPPARRFDIYSDPQTRTPSTAEFAFELTRRSELLSVAMKSMTSAASTLAAVTNAIVGALWSGGRVLTAGNGGSAAEAQHMAAELVGRFRIDRDPYCAIALTADTSTLTAVSNDYGYHEVFSRQIQAHGRPGDVFIAFSTSGNSENLIKAAQAAASQSIVTVAVTGQTPNQLASMADLSIAVPSHDTPVIQEVHAVVVHLLCGAVERTLSCQQMQDGD